MVLFELSQEAYAKLSLPPHPIEHKTLISHLSPSQSLSGILKKSKIVHPTIKIPVRSPQLEASLEKARKIINQREYDRMCSTVKVQEKETIGNGKDIKGAQKVVSGVVNISFSAAAVFMAIFWIGNGVTESIGLKTLLALTGSLIIIIAEGYFFFKDLLLNPNI
jgi:hypothetical protein